MAQLRLARAYAMHGNTAKARAADQGFLTLWKDADRDISILIACSFGRTSPAIAGATLKLFSYCRLLPPREIA
ncbi:MAG TPA: hypothetical protein VEW05_22635 [Candidatus Polarisedimenticolia bacterium]|nr:hypothetical protein [Candidatus Polarisedimenticolia bacterium]